LERGPLEGTAPPRTSPSLRTRKKPSEGPGNHITQTAASIRVTVTTGQLTRGLVKIEKKKEAPTRSLGTTNGKISGEKGPQEYAERRKTRARRVGINNRLEGTSPRGKEKRGTERGRISTKRSFEHGKFTKEQHVARVLPTSPGGGERMKRAEKALSATRQSKNWRRGKNGGLCGQEAEQGDGQVPPRPQQKEWRQKGGVPA